MKQRFIIIISIIVSLLFVMMAFSGHVDKNSNNIINNNISNNDYVKIGNITFMNNFNISNNGISFNNINKTNINNINNYENNDIKNNNITSYKYSYIKTNNTNYLLQYYNNSNIKYTIAFTDTFNNYKVEIGNIIYNNNNDNISYIYANIAPINSSKILLGNEFTLNYKSTYNNEIKNLINSIELISLNYMNSNNNTLYKFGLEYSYIALVMNNMLKSTNNNIKNMEIDKTLGIAIDWNWNCINSVLVLAGTIAAWFIASALFAVAPLTGGTSVWIGILFLIGTGLSIGLTADATYNVGNACFGGW